MNAFRYRDGVSAVAWPPDKTPVKLAVVLQIELEMLARAGREHAAKLLSEIPVDELPTAEDPVPIESVPMPSGKVVLARRVLGAFSTDVLRAEIQRREAKLADDALYGHDDSDEDAALHEELAEDLRTKQWREQ